jgi:hypothetical protein
MHSSYAFFRCVQCRSGRSNCVHTFPLSGILKRLSSRSPLLVCVCVATQNASSPESGGRELPDGGPKTPRPTCFPEGFSCRWGSSPSVSRWRCLAVSGGVWRARCNVGGSSREGDRGDRRGIEERPTCFPGGSPFVSILKARPAILRHRPDTLFCCQSIAPIATWLIGSLEHFEVGRRHLSDRRRRKHLE